MEYYSITDIGSFRNKNQDAYYAGTNKDGDFLAVVCDGIGGGKAGEVASMKTVEYLNNNFPQSGNLRDLEDTKSYASFLIKKASEYVYGLSISNAKYYGMGTTITGIYISRFGKFVLNIGDSRTYGVNKSEIVELTDDDSLVNEMLKKGQITPEEAENHPDKHCITKAIGIFSSIEPKISEVGDFDYFVVCSDGLHGYVDENKILEVVTDNDETLKQKCDELVSLSLLAGGYDNITVVLIKCQK